MLLGATAYHLCCPQVHPWTSLASLDESVDKLVRVCCNVFPILVITYQCTAVSKRAHTHTHTHTHIHTHVSLLNCRKHLHASLNYMYRFRSPSTSSCPTTYTYRFFLILDLHVQILPDSRLICTDSGAHRHFPVPRLAVQHCAIWKHTRTAAEEVILGSRGAHSVMLVVWVHKACIPLYTVPALHFNIYTVQVVLQWRCAQCYVCSCGHSKPAFQYIIYI